MRSAVAITRPASRSMRIRLARGADELQADHAMHPTAPAAMGMKNALVSRPAPRKAPSEVARASEGSRTSIERSRHHTAPKISRHSESLPRRANSGKNIGTKIGYARHAVGNARCRSPSARGAPPSATAPRESSARPARPWLRMNRAVPHTPIASPATAMSHDATRSAIICATKLMPSVARMSGESVT